MAWLSNDKGNIKIDNANFQNAGIKEATTETSKGSASFFKSIQGVVTEYLTKQIRIPSTAFTPAFNLTTKQAFSKILLAISVISQASSRIQKLGDIFSKDKKHNRSYKKKEYVKKVITRRIRGV